MDYEKTEMDIQIKVNEEKKKHTDYPRNTSCFGLGGDMLELMVLRGSDPPQKIPTQKTVNIK